MSGPAEEEPSPVKTRTRTHLTHLTFYTCSACPSPPALSFGPTTSPTWQLREMSGPAEEGPSPVKAFLDTLSLAPYRDLLKAHGYDEPADFGNMTSEEVEAMKDTLAKAGMKSGHLGRLARSINQLRPAAENPHTPPPSAGSAVPAPPSLMAAAATLVGAATAIRGTEAHLARVERWRSSLNGRLLFGRSDPSLALKPHQIAMNEAADKLLREEPHTRAVLVSFRGSVVQTQPLIEACNLVVAGTYDYTKKQGSRAGGLVGAVGFRGGPSAGPPISDGAPRSEGSPAANNPKGQRTQVAGDLKMLRLAQIPKLLEANQTECKLQVAKRDAAALKNQIAEAIEAASRLTALHTAERELQEEQLRLQRSFRKATYDSSRAASSQAVLGDGAVPSPVPKVTAETLGAGISASELELVQLLEGQLLETASFGREATSHGRLRISPLQGLDLDDFVYAETQMCRMRAHEPKAGCQCSFLIQCATRLAKAAGGRMLLSDLWSAVSDTKQPKAQVGRCSLLASPPPPHAQAACL